MDSLDIWHSLTLHDQRDENLTLKNCIYKYYCAVINPSMQFIINGHEDPSTVTLTEHVRRELVMCSLWYHEGHSISAYNRNE